jgi:allantoate deiminase
MSSPLAHEVVCCCRAVAQYSEQPGVTTRTFLSPPMREVHAHLGGWMKRVGMTVGVDAVGNLRGVYPAANAGMRRLLIGSHLDTVPNAGAFDGVLGVVLGVALVELLGGDRCPFSIEVVGFSEEEGVRYGVPFIGSRALAGTIDDELLDRTDASGATVRDAIGAYGLDLARLGDARCADGAIGYLEMHLEQGPVLDRLDLPVGVVDAIAGQSRLEVAFAGVAAHAGTTPMNARHDALAAAAEWIGAVEREAGRTSGLVATVGRLGVAPGVANVVPGGTVASLDVRHVDDGVRVAAVDRLLASADALAASRGIGVHARRLVDQAAVPMDPALLRLLEASVARGGLPVHRIASGAGHDAMILASRMPACMLFLRTPGGVSHHPDEAVLEDDVAAALAVARRFLERIGRSISCSI